MIRRSYFKVKPKKVTLPKRLKKKSESETALVKDAIQDTVRDIVIIRDGGCIARATHWHSCSSRATKDGHLVLQADHLITRSNGATYADTRLIVCVCQGLHGWKKWNEREYDRRIYELLPPDRQQLWDRAHAARFQAHRKFTYDWKIELAALKQELALLDKKGE